ncbi:type II secretory pathway pseudopilin PulG [Natronospira proteinivora]|uniref:Type II secretory pathway pseudopilin PulG n=2 Tax=Natronospira proteinivora TaxID=1807133 RepID=A0ABT1G9U8_9GAMM|nr:type II secretory pathway pseudopilin PulG [Natronospira proteinivora]
MVLVILGVLAVVAVPRFTGGTPYEARGYLDELSSAARYAQLQATVTGCQARFQVAGGDYRLDHADNCSPGDFGNTPIPHPSRGGPFQGSLPSGVSASDVTVVFDALGVPLSGGGSAVTVSGGGFSGSFLIHDQTGHVVRQ